MAHSTKAQQMGESLNLNSHDHERINRILQVKLQFLKGEKTAEEARKELLSFTDRVTAQEFAICEQYLQEYGISDDLLQEKMDDILIMFDGILEMSSDIISLPPGHPVDTYMKEVQAIRNVLARMKELLGKKFIKNPWLEVYDQLSQINTHFARKQHQLFPMLEKKGFDKPSKIMWSLDNEIRDKIKESRHLLEQDSTEQFLEKQEKVITMVEDMMVKESEILYPTSLELLDDNDFAFLRNGDDEIGYCLIDTPPSFVPSGTTQGVPQYSQTGSGLSGEHIASGSVSADFMSDLSDLLKKYGMSGKSQETEEVLPVSQGQLTLEQINLIFKHLSVDLSYVDEDEIVKFYSDTKHRVFPRSPGVIGRQVVNCHPRDSVAMVEEIIRAFRSGEQDEAEFWLEMGGKFIYILYTAVRDENGRFRGVLEMMQDATHIRSLTGSQRLLSWQNGSGQNSSGQSGSETEGNVSPADNSNNDNNNDDNIPFESEFGLTPSTNIGELVKKYPFIKSFMPTLSPKYEKLQNPLIFKAMAPIATLEMVGQRGGYPVWSLIRKLEDEIKKHQ